MHTHTSETNTEHGKRLGSRHARCSLHLSSTHYFQTSPRCQHSRTPHKLLSLHQPAPRLGISSSQRVFLLTNATKCMRFLQVRFLRADHCTCLNKHKMLRRITDLSSHQFLQRKERLRSPSSPHTSWGLSPSKPFLTLLLQKGLDKDSRKRLQRAESGKCRHNLHAGERANRKRPKSL